MSGFLIGLAVTAVVAWLIVKKYQPHAVLLIAGLFLLAATAVLFPETSILYGKTKSTGWVGFDIFNYVKESMGVQAAGIGMIIMAAGGFAKYMDHIGATDAMVEVCIGPLKLLKAPYVVLGLGYAVGQVLNIFIPSAAGLAMLLLVTFYPTLVRLGVSRAAAAAMIGTTAVLDLGPASGTANLAAKTAGLDPAIYFVQYQIPVSVVTVIVISVLTYITARYFDRRDGHVVTMEGAGGTSPSREIKKVPAVYAILPMVPLTLILVFSKLLVDSIKMDVVTAMIIGMLLGLLCEALRSRDMRTVLKGMMAFFDGMGRMFGRIVTLIICAETFAAGLRVVGAVDFMISLVHDGGLGITIMTLLMCAMVSATAIITGSGVAAFFSFASLTPTIAAKFGVGAVSMLLPMQLAAGLARSMSPVAGVIIAVSDAGQCSPFEIVRRTVIPVGGGMVAMVLYSVIFV